MTTIDIDDSLRAQSQILLRKLKDKQGKLQNILNSSSVQDEAATEVKQGLQDPSLNTTRDRSLEGRNKQRKVNKSKADKDVLNQDRLENKENFLENSHKDDIPTKDIDTCEFRSRLEKDETMPGGSSIDRRTQQNEEPKNERDETSCKSLNTPNTVRRRKIIDRNVRVGQKNLDESMLMKECEDDMPRLNFSYSGIEDADLQYLQTRFRGELPPVESSQETAVKDKDMRENVEYKDKLENAGNSRKYAKFIRETSKPKSILLATDPTSQRQNKSSGKVSFHSTQGTDMSNRSYMMNSTLKDNQKMLGYDWIAALMENDPNAVNQSETFFEELREFRRVNREECVNQIYMDGPAELWEHPEREPSPVAKALEETRRKETEVKPYLVNDRLFTEPIKRSLFADYDVEDKSKNKKEKEPTYDEPRFVRVSIPRSTLQSPHRVKPHRRRSFDPTDTMALSEHCLKGWDTSSINTMPAASNIGLRDATTGIKSTIKTTLDDAEKLAANYPYHWNPAEQKISRPQPKLSVRPETAYMDASRSNINQTDSSLFNSTKGLKQATDDLLNSTYSLMYEMQRLKTERNSEPVKINQY